MIIKSRNHTIFLSTIIALALGAISMISLPAIMHMQSASAAGTMSVTFSSSPTSPTVGSNVTVTANASVPSSENPISTLKLRFSYDSSKLEFVSQSSSGTVFSSCTYLNSAATTNLPQFACGSDTGSLYGGKVASVTFKVLQSGSTSVTGVDIANAAGDTTFSPYTVNFTPATITTPTPTTDPSLQALTVNTGTLSPAFSPSTTSYAVSVPNNITSIIVSATAPAGGTKSGDGTKSLSVGANTITITGTAGDGTTKQYTVVVTRAAYVPSNNANLSSLSVSGYTLSPAFSAGNTGPYTLTVPHAAATVTIAASPAQSGATITGSGSKTLSVGENTLPIVVTAEDGTKKTYTIKITRPAPPEVPDTGASTDSSLGSLDIGGYTLSPAFSPSVTSYAISVGPSVTGLNVSAIPTDSKATVEVTGASGWQTGVNNVIVTITAEDGSKTIYTVAVTRAADSPSPSDPSDSSTPSTPYVPSTSTKSSDASLSSITDSTGLGLLSDFSSDKASYDINVPYEIDQLGLIATAKDGKAQVEITGDGDFKVGMNTVVIKVTAEDGSERYYTINVNRSAASGELSDISLGGGATLSPAFSSATRRYTTSVPASADCLDLSAAPLNPEAKVTVIGNCGLKAGKNLVQVRVEYEPGKFADYFVEVDKAYPPTILGMPTWLFWILLGLFLLLLGIILALLIRKRRRTVRAAAVAKDTENPAIVFRPEFNFGSKNNADSQNDVVSGSHSNMSEDAAIDDADTNRLGPSSDLIAPGHPISADPDQIRRDTLSDN